MYAQILCTYLHICAEESLAYLWCYYSSIIERCETDRDRDLAWTTYFVGMRQVYTAHIRYVHTLYRLYVSVRAYAGCIHMGRKGNHAPPFSFYFRTFSFPFSFPFSYSAHSHAKTTDVIVILLSNKSSRRFRRPVLVPSYIVRCMSLRPLVPTVPERHQRTHRTLARCTYDAP